MATEPSSPPTGTAPPTAPSRGDAPSVFRTRADAFVAWIVTFYTFLTNLTTWQSDTATEVFDNATEANTSAETATTKAGEASNAAIQAALSAAASATTGINPADYDAGDRLEVVPDGAGGFDLAMVGGVPRQKIVALSGTTPSLDLSLGQIFTITLTGSTTFSFDTTNLVNVAGQGLPFHLIVEQGATAYGLSWPANVNWDNDEEPAPPGALQRGFYVGLYDAVSDTTFLWLTSRSAA